MSLRTEYILLLFLPLQCLCITFDKQTQQQHTKSVKSKEKLFKGPSFLIKCRENKKKNKGWMKNQQTKYFPVVSAFKSTKKW